MLCTFSPRNLILACNSSFNTESKDADRDTNWSYEETITLINIWSDINICLKNRHRLLNIRTVNTQKPLEAQGQTTILCCVLNALEYNTQAIFGAEIWKKKTFWVNFDKFWILGNSSYHIGILVFWYHAVISYTCNSIIQVPLGITADVTKYNFGVDRNCLVSPMYIQFFML